MTNERRSASSSSSGCFSAVARLLLCKRNLQTHPSDHTPDRLTQSQNKDHYFDDCQEVANQITIPEAPAPGVVARLMGLESLPPTPARRRASSAVEDSVTRSRSVNFMDYYLLQHDFDFSSTSSNARHRRVRTSVSFREVSPAAAAPDFILLYLEGNNNSKVEKPKKRTSSKVIRKREQKKEVIGNKNAKLKETEQKKQRARKQSTQPVVNNNDRCQQRKKVSHNRRRKCAVRQKEVAVESNFMKKIKNRKFVIDGTGSSCPISSVPPPLSGEKTCERKLERKQSPAAKNHDETERYVAKLTEEDVNLSFWVAAKGGNVAEYRGFEEMCKDFEQELLDLLVDELVWE